MQQSESYQTIYQRLLTSTELQPITKFKSSKSTVLVYPDAHKYPQFFNHNLLQQGRVIKVVTGKSAILKAFCYQLMKLTFQLDIAEIDYVEVFKSVVFHPALLLEDTDMQSPSSGRTYTDRQYKRILADFVQIMIQQSIPNFEFTLMEYPIVEEALIRTFQGLISRCYPGTSGPTKDLLQWLSKTFQMGLEKFGKCYKFQESDIFLYEENSEEYYIAFLNQMAQVSDYSESTYRLDDKKSPSDRKSRMDKEEIKATSQDLMHSSQALQDYKLQLHSDKYRYSAQIYMNKRTEEPTSFRKTIENSKSFIKDLARQMDESIHDKPFDKYSKIGSLLDIMSDRSSKDLEQKFKTPEQISSGQLSQQQRSKTPSAKAISLQKLETEQVTPKFTTSSHLNTEDHYNPFTKKYSENYIEQMYQTNQSFDYVSKMENNYLNEYSDNKYQNQNYYNEAAYKFSPYTPAQVKQHFIKNPLLQDSQDGGKATITKIQEDQLFYNPKPKASWNNKQTRMQKQQFIINSLDRQDSRGTLYRQFSDTRVLQVMASFQRMKVNAIRSKYKGLHRKDLRKPY